MLWLKVMNSLHNRWVEDIVIAVTEGHRSLSADERADLHRPIQPLLPVRLRNPRRKLLHLLQNIVQLFLREPAFRKPANLVHRHVVQECFDCHVGFLFSRSLFGRQA
jgi:hypothetical protein